MFTTNDIIQLNYRGVSTERAEHQLHQFQTGFPFMNLNRPATLGDGIIKFSDSEIMSIKTEFEQYQRQGITITKFVPASGAATRMFKTLFDFLNSEPEIIEHAKLHPHINEFIEKIENFPFSKELELKAGIKFDGKKKVLENSSHIIKKLLTESGLNYGNLPKGVLKFHRINNQEVTPIEEHMVEGARYAVSRNQKVNIHFTVSPEHEQLFRKITEVATSELEKRFGVVFQIEFSHQKPSTDTLAVNPDNTPFRLENGALLFRPAGHGALIENLNDLDTDLVFIKNIDNVVPEHQLNDTVLYKQVIAGTLCLIQQKVFAILKSIEERKDVNVIKSEVAELEQILQFSVAKSFLNLSDDNYIIALKSFLNRPIRVCGMVKNQGEPGGGPFWVNDGHGAESLQIVESSQIDLNNQDKKAIFDQSTHFNPVDLVCSLKDYKGKKFDLTAFTDPNTGFISEKSLNGKPLKALELPGLWNGAMANWLTAFVEVPLSTFNPVKTVNDLLRPQHQAGT